MLRDAPFVDTPECWTEIIDFPGYAISDQGRVMNTQTKNSSLIKITRNSRGLPIVGLMKDGTQYKRSVSLLVAATYVPRPSNELFDTPINLNGDRMDNHHANLAWRPLWFARKYHRQFLDEPVSFDYPIEDVETGEVYKNTRHASIVNGVLDKEIYISMVNNGYVFPTGQVFREAL